MSTPIKPKAKQSWLDKFFGRLTITMCVGWVTSAAFALGAIDPQVLPVGTPGWVRTVLLICSLIVGAANHSFLPPKSES